MSLALVTLALLILGVCDARSQGPAVALARFLSTATLSQERYGSCVCQFGPVALIVGGYTSDVNNASVASVVVDIFDSVNITYKTPSQLSISRSSPTCASDTVNNKCYVLGGGSHQVEVITVNTETFAVTVDFWTNYPVTNVSHLACEAVGAAIYCAGGSTTGGVRVASSYFTNLTQNDWTPGPDIEYPTEFNINGTNSAGVLNASVVAFCGGTSGDQNYGSCYFWNTTDHNMTTVIGFNTHASQAWTTAVQYPIPRVLQYAGNDGVSLAANVLDSYNFNNATNHVIYNISEGTHAQIYNNGGTAGSIWTIAFFVGGVIPNNTNKIDFIHIVDYNAGRSAPITGGVRLEVARAGSAVTAYGHSLFIHGGLGNDDVFLSSLEVLALGCTEPDLWITNETFNGCETPADAVVPPPDSTSSAASISFLFALIVFCVALLARLRFCLSWVLLSSLCD